MFLVPSVSGKNVVTKVAGSGVELCKIIDRERSCYRDLLTMMMMLSFWCEKSYHTSTEFKDLKKVQEIQYIFQNVNKSS